MVKMLFKKNKLRLASTNEKDQGDLHSIPRLILKDPVALPPFVLSLFELSTFTTSSVFQS